MSSESSPNVAFITGSSIGIGKESAKHFASQGYNVVATMRAPEKETELKNSDNMLVTRLDVTDASSIAEAVKAAIDKFGRIDVLVNNAGYGSLGALEHFSMEKTRRQFDTNVFGLMSVIQAVLPHMRKQESGSIVNISSIAGRIGFPLNASYAATKFAVEGLSESLSLEVAPLGIKVAIIEPGAIKTEFGFNMDMDTAGEGYRPIAEKYENVIPGIFNTGSPATLAAEAIFTAATDGSKKLRYPVGPDAEKLLALRDTKDDAEVFEAVKAMYGL